ncbi:MAG: hypothetical protein ABSG53_01780, partial [Thermoguttaceae bacterium]
ATEEVERTDRIALASGDNEWLRCCNVVNIELDDLMLSQRSDSVVFRRGKPSWARRLSCRRCRCPNR